MPTAGCASWTAAQFELDCAAWARVLANSPASVEVSERFAAWTWRPFRHAFGAGYLSTPRGADQYHIVLSPAYQVPVLVRVPCLGASLELALLPPPFELDVHPVLGTPCHVSHACQVPDTLQLMLGGGALRADEDGAAGFGPADGWRLLVWYNIVTRELPDLALTPRQFVAAQRALSWQG
jgi:hypothetical protein